jgi:hypothetical protein
MIFSAFGSGQPQVTSSLAGCCATKGLEPLLPETSRGNFMPR